MIVTDEDISKIWEAQSNITQGWVIPTRDAVINTLDIITATEIPFSKHPSSLAKLSLVEFAFFAEYGNPNGGLPTLLMALWLLGCKIRCPNGFSGDLGKIFTNVSEVFLVQLLRLLGYDYYEDGDVIRECISEKDESNINIDEIEGGEERKLKKYERNEIWAREMNKRLSIEDLLLLYKYHCSYIVYWLLNQDLESKHGYTTRGIIGLIDRLDGANKEILNGNIKGAINTMGIKGVICCKSRKEALAQELRMNIKMEVFTISNKREWTRFSNEKLLEIEEWFLKEGGTLMDPQEVWWF